MSEYLSEEEQLARMKSWWDENGTSLLVGLVLAVAAVGGWQWYGSYSEDRDLDAARAYEAYEQAAEGAAKEAARQTIIGEHAGTAYHVFVLFDLAQEALDGGDLSAAEAALERAIAAADDDLLADLGKIRLAKVQHGLDRTAEALQTLAAIRNSGYQSWALEAQGDIHMARGDMQAAHQAYEAAVQNLAAGDTRPVLDMKLKNAAPFDGAYVAQTDSLAEALREAEEALDVTSAAADAEAAPASLPEDAVEEDSAAQAAETVVEDTVPAPAEDSEAQPADDA